MVNKISQKQKLRFLTRKESKEAREGEDLTIRYDNSLQEPRTRGKHATRGSLGRNMAP
ncbi:hypothetical protein HAX54_032357, partial [Datura stramonium]|nr:hypothetical protein [Datura stramonium]